MNESIGIDLPEGKIARIQFKPVDERNKVAKLDGPLEVAVLEDPTQTTQPPAEAVVGGPSGLVVDIKLPDEIGALASVEVGGDTLEGELREVITTLITLRRVAEAPGKAVSLGATTDTVAFPNADQFGQFPTA